MANYTIQAGDTLSKIAQKFGTTVKELAAKNGIVNPNFIVTGKEISVGENKSNFDSFEKTSSSKKNSNSCEKSSTNKSKVDALLKESGIEVTDGYLDDTKRNMKALNTKSSNGLTYIEAREIQNKLYAQNRNLLSCIKYKPNSSVSNVAFNQDGMSQVNVEEWYKAEAAIKELEEKYPFIESYYQNYVMQQQIEAMTKEILKDVKF